MTGPLGPHRVVLGSALRPPVLSADGSGDLPEGRPQWTAVSSAVQLWCVLFDVKQDVQAQPTLGRGCGQCDLRSGENTGP